MSTAATDRWPLTGRHEQMEDLVAALRAPGCHGVVLHGPAGVGKTRLASELAAHAAQAGRRVLRAIATRSAAAVPLGALAHLLAASDGSLDADPVALLERARAAMADAGAHPPVLLVDDAHLLDGVSLTLLGQLVASGGAFLMATVRSGEAVPDGLSALWRSEEVRRMDLGDLTRADVDTLLHLSLGGPVEGRATAALWEASRGNPLFLHELVATARQSGALRESHGVWQLDGPVTSRRLAEVLEDRLRELAPEARSVLDLLALCEPLALGDLPPDVAPTLLEELEADGLISVDPFDRRQELRIAHPLYAEVLRSAMPVLRRRRLLEAQADAIAARGARRPEDARRIAMWRLDAGVAADPDLLVRGALLARHTHDFELVARLAEAALQSRTSVEAGVLLGEACYELGRFERAEEVLAEATLRCEDDAQLLRVAAARQTNLFWGLLRADDAVAVIRAARDAVAGDEARAALISAEASTVMYGGRPDLALALLDGLSGEDARARVLRAIPEAPALALGGQTAAAIRVADRGLEEHLGLIEEIAISHPGTHVATKVLALGEAGRIAEGLELAAAGYQVAVENQINVGQIWFTLNLSRLSLLQGRPATAERWAREAAAVARTKGFTGPLRMAMNALSVSLAWRGDAAGAAAAAAECEALPGRFDFMLPERGLGRGWAAAAAGRLAEGRAHLLDAATVAEETGHLTVASWLLHDVARLGGAAQVAERLTAIAARCDSALVDARAAHAQAVAADDADALVAAADAFEGLGAWLVAAEAAIGAAEALRGDGEQRRAAGQAARGEALQAQCEGAVTPGLVAAPSVVPLTGREREVAVLAAGGVSSKEIADRLYLSVRTVNNHLQHAYTKLGVASRRELAVALGVAAGE